MKPSTLRALLEGDLENAVISEMPGGIEAQEARGQRDFIASESLPKDFNVGTREQLESMGVVFGDSIDDLFIEVQLPDGWKKVPTNHSMWSDLVDDEGRKRAAIFYKAAFYDRRAHIDLIKRYTYEVRPVKGWDASDYWKGEWCCVVTDGGEIIWKSDKHLEPEPSDKDKFIEWYDAKKSLGELGREWLELHYPDWNDLTSYW